MYSSIPIANTCTLIDTVECKDNPMLTACTIKVCYVCEDMPNQNRTSMSKAMLTELGKTLPGSPIVGFYDEEGQDFEGHKREFEFNNEGQVVFKDMTKAYGYVPNDAQVRFEKYMDDGHIEREYLVTDGYLWTGRYAEAQRIIKKGNNQSMELHEPSMDVTPVSGTKETGGGYFVINAATLSALCILGEEVKPCFEGASITSYGEFSLLSDSLQKDFEKMMYSTQPQVVENGGKTMSEKVRTQYAVEIGSGLWNVIYNKLDTAYPNESGWCSKYSIEGIYEEAGTKFVILQEREVGTYHRLNFALSETAGAQFDANMIEVTQTFVEVTNQYSAEDIKAWENARYNKDAGQSDNVDNSSFAKKDEDNEKASSDDKSTEGDSKDKSENDEDKEKDKKANHSARQSDCSAEYAALQQQHADLMSKFSAMQSQLEPLVNFKKAADLKEKQAMLAKFSMLPDELKLEVVKNINNYSVDEIESRLAVLCVRNNVNFAATNAEEDQNPQNPGAWQYSVAQAVQTNVNEPSFLGDLRATRESNGMI